MYVIIVYDIGVTRVTKVCNYLRQYLNWVQNSVFEGEVTKGKLEKIRAGLKKRIDDEVDSIYIYKVRNEKWLDREVMGTEKSPTDTII
ncbi:MAG: CRISPR-associated endonuclease Cas2 [Candidatus Bipolaricaulia bacterium]